ncbi:translocation protein TolB [Caulifigura coniformis]|uniref:Translocation protein TolB n=1 Tax=Caulifigura coniformis TaxID=2527983 RepID=A0A517SL27_9PLAN|nr:hypothetical protein [Caulifigura coniformis]QDT56839.1 translocation protein TolB [Caulifigura coniformis]
MRIRDLTRPVAAVSLRFSYGGAFVAVSFLAALAGGTVHGQGLPVLKTPSAVYEINEDGTGWKKVVTPGEFSRIGSLRPTSDGARLCFDGVKAGEAWSDAMLLSCRMDGSDLQVHGHGAMPNLSPDGKRLSYCSYDDQTVRIRNLEDQTETVVEPGWGVQWSPVSNQIAYVVGGGSVVVRDLETSERRTLFPADSSPYDSVSFNMAWSHDGRQIAVQGRRPGGVREIAVVDAQGAEFGFRPVSPMSTVSNFLAFHPSGRKIAFQAYLKGTKGPQIYVVDLDQRNEPQRLAGQPADFDNVGAAWVDGGRKLLVIGQQR